MSPTTPSRCGRRITASSRKTTGSLLSSVSSCPTPMSGPAQMRYLTMMDVHSIDRLRINGALAQCDYWYDAFGIQPTDSLYVKPEDRVRIW